MASKYLDQNVLFAVIMLRNDFVTKSQCALLLDDWMNDGSQSVAKMAIAKGWIQQDDAVMLNQLVQKRVEKHGNLLDSIRHDAPSVNLQDVHFNPKTIKSLVDSVLPASFSQRNKTQRSKQLATTPIDATTSLMSDTGGANNIRGSNSEPSGPNIDIDASLTIDTKDRSMDSSVGPISEDSAIVIRPATDAPKKDRPRFSFLRSHAKGGLGKVSVALDTELDREVALKEIRSTYADDAVSRDRFCVEARITGGLEHPGVVPVYGFGTDTDGSPYFAMRFIKGITLKEAVLQFHKKYAGQDTAEKRLEFRDLLSRFVASCNAIAYAHNRGVIHRDIKPSNIMLGKFGETLVVDWGLAKQVGRETITKFDDELSLAVRGGTISGTLDGSTIGTPTFMSPEQANGNLKDIKASTDIYSLGSTLYYILTGRTAFTGPSASQVVALAKKNEFRIPTEVNSSIPAALGAIACKAMTTEPEGRYASALLLASDIENWMADEPVSSYQENVFLRTSRWLRRHRTLATSLGVLALTVAVASLVGMLLVNAEKNRTVAALDQVSAEKFKTEEALAKLEIAQAETTSALEAETNARRKTREVLNTVTDDIVGELLARNIELGNEDREFFDRVLNQFEDFTSVNADSTQSANIRADGYLRVGNLQRRLDDLDAAEKSYLQAEKLWNSLISENPNSTESLSFRADLAAVSANYGFLLAQLGRHKEALAKENQAAELLQQLVEEFPDDEAYHLRYAKLLGNRANANMRLKQNTAAESDYQKAITTLESLIEQNDSPELQTTHATTLSNLASFYSRQKSKLADAEKLFQASIEQLSALPTVDGNSAKIERELAREKQNLANVLFNQKRSDEAVELYESAINSQIGLANKYPSLALYQQDLGRSRAGLGRTLSVLGLAGAEDQLLEAKSIATELVGTFPDRVEFQKQLASIHDDLARLYRNSDTKKAKDMYQEGLRIREEIESIDESQVNADQAIASAINFANFLRKSKEYLEAIKTYETVLEKLDDQEDPPANLVRATLFGLGDSCVKSERYNRALQCWTRLTENDQDPNWQAFELQRAICLVRVGDVDEGVSAAEEMLKEAADPEANRGLLNYDIACCFAVAAKVETQKDKSEKHAVRAIELLYNAGFEKFFNQPMKEHAATDVDLDALREREDFKEFCKEFEIETR